jgi:transposase
MAKPGPRRAYRCSDQFKATAVRPSQLPGVSVQDVAISLYTMQFHRGIFQIRVDAAFI